MTPQQPSLIQASKKMKITRARTSYNFFFHDERQRIQEVILRETGKRPEYPHVSKLVALKWKKLTAPEKAYYEGLAAADKRRYGLELVSRSTQAQGVHQDTSTAAPSRDHNHVNTEINQAEVNNVTICHAGPTLMTGSQESMHQAPNVHGSDYTSFHPRQPQGNVEDIEDTAFPLTIGNAEDSATFALNHHGHQLYNQPGAVTPENLHCLLRQLLSQPGAPEMLASLLMQHASSHHPQEPVTLSALPESRLQHHHPVDHAWIPNEMLDDDFVDVLEETFEIRRS